MTGTSKDFISRISDGQASGSRRHSKHTRIERDQDGYDNPNEDQDFSFRKQKLWRHTCFRHEK